MEVIRVADFLFARPSFLSGVARTLDLFGQFDEYNQSTTGEIADARAMYSDWRAVGEELHSAYLNDKARMDRSKPSL